MTARLQQAAMAGSLEGAVVRFIAVIFDAGWATWA